MTCETLTLQSQDSTRIIARRWVAAPTPKAALLVVHGYFEHGGRYADTAQALTARGIEVWALDLRGHGASEGSRGYIERFEDYLDDVDAVVAKMRASHGALPRFVLGHSLGGLVAYTWAEHRPQAREISGLIVTNPYMGLALRVPGWKLALARLMDRVHPRFSMPADLDPSLLSHDELKNQAYQSDPLIFGAATVRWFLETKRAQAALAGPRALPLPVLFVVGDADGIARPETTLALFERLQASDKTMTVLAGQYHEVLNEPSRAETCAAIADWIEARAIRP